MLRPLALILSLTAGTAQALCEGTGYLDTLTDAQAARVAEAAAATPNGTGLHWTATRGADRVEIIGTMHVHDPRIAPLAGRFAPLVADADVLMVEAGPEEEAQLQAEMGRNPGLVFVIDGPTLPERLDEPTWKALAEAAASRGLPAVLASKMRPWYLSLNLAIPPCAMPDLVAGRRGLDHALLAEAEASGTPVVALEAWDTLFTLMQGADEEEQIEMLKLSLVPPDVQSQVFVSMLDSYFAGEVAEVWEVSRVAVDEVSGLTPERAEEIFAETEEELLTTRNRAWIPVIEAQMGEADIAVVAVGAAHLPGEDGVIALLRDSGWTVTRAD